MSFNQKEWRKKYNYTHKKEISEYNKEWKHKNKERSKEIQKIWYENNKDKCKINHRIWHSKNKEKIKMVRKIWNKKNKGAYQRKYYAKNKERRRKENKIWRLKNIEKVQAVRKIWYDKNKEKCIIYRKNNYTNPKLIYSNIIYKIKKRKLSINISKEDFVSWYNIQPKICIYCGRTEEESIKDKNGKYYRLTIERKDNNIGYQLDNIALCCFRCNSIKGSLFNYNQMIKLGKFINEILLERS